MSWTTRFRVLAWALFSLTVLTALVGWVGWGRDPSTLGDVLMWTALAAGIGEGANVGKRATWKPEAVGSEG